MKQTSAGVIRHRVIKVDGLDIFYREGGGQDKPVILFLHGFPSSSHMYRDIMRSLSGDYRVIAPDYPGFGYSSRPALSMWDYSFDSLATLMDDFIDALHLRDITLYMQDYGGPVGFRIATRRPQLIRALVIQNANAYVEGLGQSLQPLAEYMQQPGPSTEQPVKFFLTAEATRWQYLDGTEDPSKVSPDSYTLDQHFLDMAGNEEIQLALFRNYATNLALYDEWHAYFRGHQPPALVVWGKNDQLFIAPGAEAYKRDLPGAEVHLLNGGHFLLEEHHSEVAGLMDSFLSRVR